MRRSTAALCTLTLLAAAWVPAAAPDGPAVADGRWLAGDLHIHTTYSHDAYGGPDDDNTGHDEAYTAGWSVGQQFANAAARGLDYLAITDHNDVRAHDDEGFGAHGVIPVRAYEKSLDGHAQMLGADRVYEVKDTGNDGRDARDIGFLADRLRRDGGLFQINHPGYDDPSDPDHLDWGYGHDVVPDSVEVWNISRAYQPPFPSASSNASAVAFWERFLDAGHRVAATGGSDNHYVATAAAQGAGQPTTWVYAADGTEAAILAAIAEGRTTISAQPPALGGARLFLEADGDGDGVFESMVGDTVGSGAPLRVRAEGAAGAIIRVVTTGGVVRAEIPVTSPAFTTAVHLDEPATWVRAELIAPEAIEPRRELCDPLVGDRTTYCRDEAALLAMTSALFLTDPQGRGATYAEATDDGVRLGNGLVERRWALEPFGTTAITDRRTGLETGTAPDFRLDLADGVELTSHDFRLVELGQQRLPRGGLRLTMTLEPTVAGLAGTVTRSVTAFPGIAGFETRTTVALPVTLAGYTLEEVAVGGATATAHAFSAGYDWRGSDTPDWEPTVAPFGGAHTGDHRETTTAGPGEPIDVTGQWLSLATGDPTAPRAFLVPQRVNYDSTHVAYDGDTGRAHVALDDDLVYLGPFESDVHLDNPTDAPLRTRVVDPARPLTLETTFVGFALDADDEPWQHHRYLTERRWRGWRVGDVTFNSNGVDQGRISTGAKDDMDLDEVRRQAAVARELGIETFILDDGWQGASGDWCPDSPQCPEPRGLYPDRFPDDTFAAVREELGDMRLGLWMSPMQFNPASDAYREHPEWSCHPVGDALAVYNTLEPDSSSNEAGLGTWNPLARALDSGQRLVDHIEARIERAITVYGSRYFKFDFLAWVDCVDTPEATVTAYDYREAFLAMVDRLIAAHPDVTFQIDETNDYRAFPFEAVSRGPMWYANGNPTAAESLHNLWVLAPYVPGTTIGQATLGRDRREHSVDYLMAVALGSHLTFFSDLTQVAAEVGPAGIATAADWIERYKAHRERFTLMAYPLLDDPLPGDTWSALQPWDPEAQHGALLVYRQDSDDAERRVALRGVRGDGVYRVTDAVTGGTVGTFPADTLRSGITVELTDRHSAAVWLIELDR